MRILVGIPLVLALSGCIAAIPPALTIASYAADGVSLLISGKSVSDHAISQIADEDCAMWRLLKLENPCRSYRDDVDGAPSVEVAQGGSDPDAPPSWSTSQPLWSNPGPERQIASVDRVETNAFRGTTIEVSELAPLAGPPTLATPARALDFDPLPATTSDFPAAAVAAPSVAPTAVVAALAPAAGGADLRYVVFASFTHETQAACLADAHVHIDAAVVPAEVRGKKYYRVVSSGRRLPDAQALRNQFKASGFDGAWLARDCGNGAVHGSCVAVEQRAASSFGGRNCPAAQVVLRPEPALRSADGVLAGG